MENEIQSLKNRIEILELQKKIAVLEKEISELKYKPLEFNAYYNSSHGYVTDINV
jgi:hypothetical protein